MAKLLSLVIAIALGIAPIAAAAPKAELWAHWQPHDADSAAQIDHSAWDKLLETYLQDGDGDKAGIALFDYAAVSAEHNQLLDDYLAQLARAEVAALSREEQRAYWINLYNALTVDVILQHYPVQSIRDISDGLFSSGPWGEKRFSVGGEQVSLDDIEHRILRPIWGDARIHYAVNCASLGCPNLAARAFTADNSETLLQQGAQAYVNHPRGASVREGRLTVSSIYEWFKDDFGGSDAGVIAHLRQYADETLLQDLAGIEAIDGDAYDWQLNGAE